MHQLIHDIQKLTITTPHPTSIEQKIGSMIIMGFPGTDFQEEQIQKTNHYIQQGWLGGVLLFKRNIASPEQLLKLTSALHNTRNDLFIAVDQEGGKVQRLAKDNGFRDFPSAKEVAQTQTPEQAYQTYLTLSKLLKELHINFNFAPVVDIDSDSQPCPIIGGLNRSFSPNPETVVKYGRECIRAHKSNGVLCAIKHFSGHGLASGDTHKELVDVTKTVREEELVPFHALIGVTQAVMTAHVVNMKLDPSGYPVTLSPLIIKQQLREKGGQEVAVISDDLCMGAMVRYYSFKDRVILAINAGCDLLIFSNNPLAWGKTNDCAIDVDIPAKVIQVVKEAMKEGTIKEETISQAYQRVESLRQQVRI